MTRHHRHVAEAWWASLTTATVATLLTPWGLALLALLGGIVVAAAIGRAVQ